MSNNIAEGSGNTSRREFIRFLDIARKSTFENASMMLIFAQDQIIPEEQKMEVLQDLDELSRMIKAFSRSLQEKIERNAKK